MIIAKTGTESLQKWVKHRNYLQKVMAPAKWQSNIRTGIERWTTGCDCTICTFHESVPQREWMTAELGSMIHLLCPIEKEVLFITEQRHWSLDQAMHSQSYVHPYWLSFWFTETHLSKLEIKLWRTKVFLLWNNISQSPRMVLAHNKHSGNIVECCWLE